MPGNAAPSGSERAALLGYLVQQRDGLRYATFGLTEEQIRQPPTRSALTLGGLLKHAARTEADWIDLVRGGPGASGEQAYRDSFTLTETDTLASLTADLDRVAGTTAEVVAGLDSLDMTVRLPSAPWFPEDAEGYSVRWILLHVLEELARHAGHADILREHVDGATMYELMAGAEGWPATDWLTPWQPHGGSG